MGLSSVFQWWEQQQLRSLVLGSLVVQYFLCFFAGKRKSRIPPWYRFFIWLSYLASDALAIYALATLFNRQKRMQYRSRDLQVLWAPVLLVHLGGQSIITAYNIEDNELWRRHIVTALSQVTVAIYVFCKSWSSSADKRLLAGAVCLFIPAVAKCFQKPLALMRSSFSNLDTYIDHDDWATRSNNREKKLEEFVRRARAAMLLKDPELADHDTGQYVLHPLLSDFAYPDSSRLSTLKGFCPLDDEEAHETLKYTLSNIFDLLYTQDASTKMFNVVDKSFAVAMWLFSATLQIAAIVLFHKSHKEAYSTSDVNVTFVLLYGTLLLQFISSVGLANFEGKWAGVVAQHSLLGLFAQKKRHFKLMSFARCLLCEGFVVDQFFGMESCDSSIDIMKLVRRHIHTGWKEYITDAQSYKEFNDIRGQWTLERKGCDEKLGWSIRRPLDISVLIWHLATDFCFYQESASPDLDDGAMHCREISNYMMHLLSANPEMLLPGSRKLISKIACDQLNDLFKGQETLPVDEGKLAQKVVSILTSTKDPKACFIHHAWFLYKSLTNIKDRNEMWELIQGVWVEMLCFSAGRCRGYLHAKSIGAGGEYLSYIWVLLHITGMETFQHRLQRTQKLRQLKVERKHHENQGEDAAAPSTHQDMHHEAFAGPWPSQGGYSAGAWSSQYSGGDTYQGTNLPTQGGNFAGPWSSQYFGGGTSSYQGMNLPTQGGNIGGPWSSQYYQGGVSTYQGMNLPTEERNAAGPCFQM